METLHIAEIQFKSPPPKKKSGNCVILTYNKPLDIRSSIKFDFKIFIVILVLTYLLAYKLTDYIANFNTVKHQSRIEIIFLLIFFLFLFVPISHTSQNEISVKENRKLAKWKPLIKKNGKINFNFGKDYNDWFNDRFNLRQFFLDSQIRMLLPITDKMPKGRIDKEDFIWADFEMVYDLDKIKEEDYKALIEFNKYCKAHNIELYVLFSPVRRYIYTPTKHILMKDEYANNIDKKVKELNRKYDMHIVNPLKELQDGAKNNYMYYKTDPHWTFDGAYIGYKELMKEINKRHKDIYVLQDKDFNYYENCLVIADYKREFYYGNDTGHINLPDDYSKKIHKTNYRYFTHKKSDLLKIKQNHIPYHFNKIYYFPDGADYRILVLGTSVIENLDEFIPYTFKHVFQIRNNYVKNIPREEEFKIIKHYEQEILEYKPDIIVFSVAYNNMCHLRNLFNKD